MRDPALLYGEVSQIREKLINGSEHDLDLFDMLNLHLIDVHKLDLVLVREVLENLAELLDTFLVDDHVFVRFTSENDRLNVGIRDNLVSNVLIAERG